MAPLNIPLLTADQARAARTAFDAGRPWVMIERGEPCEAIHITSIAGGDIVAERPFCHACNDSGYVAPRLWADLDKPCDTCGNSDWPGYLPVEVSGYDVEFGRTRDIRCPDCRDGRQVWELRTECRDNQAPSTFGVQHRGSYDGSVLVARVTVQVVPVIKDDDYEPTYAAIVIDDGVAYLLDTDGAGQAVTFDPLPTPGRDFGVVFREAK